jgi:hypothetical protein
VNIKPEYNCFERIQLSLILSQASLVLYSLEGPEYKRKRTKQTSPDRRLKAKSSHPPDFLFWSQAKTRHLRSNSIRSQHLLRETSH